MAYNTLLAAMVRTKLEAEAQVFTEKAMFGGLAFFIDEKMCLGVTKNELMFRVMPEKEAEALALPHTKVMDFTGRPMKAFLMAEADIIEDEKTLDQLVAYGIEFGEKGVVISKKKKP